MIKKEVKKKKKIIIMHFNQHSSVLPGMFRNFLLLLKKKQEPAHAKTYNKICATSEDLDQPLHSFCLIRVFADCKRLLQPPGYPKRDEQEPLSYKVNLQADLSICRLNRSYCRFYRAVSCMSTNSCRQ